MRIITRPDFDGIVCAALLHEAEPIRDPILWVQPSEVQQQRVPIRPGDIVANLPYIRRNRFRPVAKFPIDRDRRRFEK
jgi:hypothetical protein